MQGEPRNEPVFDVVVEALHGVGLDVWRRSAELLELACGRHAKPVPGPCLPCQGHNSNQAVNRQSVRARNFLNSIATPKLSYHQLSETTQHLSYSQPQLHFTSDKPPFDNRPLRVLSL